MVHSTKVEIIWTIIPVVILVVMAIPAAELILKMEDMRNADLSIRVTGYQWKWQYQYMDAAEGINFFSTLKQDSNFARQLHSGYRSRPACRTICSMSTTRWSYRAAPRCASS